MENAVVLTTLGVLFLAGLVADQFGSMTRLPRVTMLLLLGLGAGQAGFDLIPEDVTLWFDAISIVALTMVAFLLGGALSRDNLLSHGRAILAISVAIVLATLVMVSAGLILVGVPPGLALILGAIATATAPAAMADVIRQSGISNPFTDTLKGIVAIDDVWGLLVFSIALVLAGQAASWGDVAVGAARDLGGAVVLGIVLGIPAAQLTGRLSPGEPLQAEAIGVVFLSAGLALWFEVSFLVTGMTVGAVVTNLARHHERAFHEIENLQWPFMILFFLLAGASLEVEALFLLGWTGVIYMVLRIVARWIGGIVGSWIGGVDGRDKVLFGPALLPQAGVAVGMALVAGDTFPQWAASIMALTIASTVVFEIMGPPITLAIIRRQARGGSGS
ncbi:cation:proton antiporter [Ponticoccus sp. SC2-23]|uniref:cation:proton antiporter n=1 Tax=Alexandriicola marinus TaxID=2081710 RepID=UPI000FDB8336|nr:cation:proton antiporter [Alexandriicola marinus]MBM1221177.1 cation:proton antiporter [Ponticoccus sp. SC6-9]MBM1225747.1 cation:proton antiporter [Ponticoccus sp. SC6-15]MBM1227899.1 cation:proton antiporter [Ponticoccus sp. SC6-38]MBM1234463.1 cation:proton antiporter [Ponticoccus sp. SC6-45]MBM1238401.1 cation:proton antiporter [Ponticoccus sp. SC6-49]MBM1243670.1 cation:proton antiporter [Ponticoccus sp. SC2-64]MBM1247987.1 cation:proton antiporter [Ponticoccus sp. SC6-42]MBM1252801